MNHKEFFRNITYTEILINLFINIIIIIIGTMFAPLGGGMVFFVWTILSVIAFIWAIIRFKKVSFRIVFYSLLFSPTMLLNFLAT
jgi:hypothetical protein